MGQVIYAVLMSAVAIPLLILTLPSLWLVYRVAIWMLFGI